MKTNYEIMQANVDATDKRNADEAAANRAKKAAAPYGEWCRDPTLCAGKGYCPRDPTCGD